MTNRYNPDVDILEERIAELKRDIEAYEDALEQDLQVKRIEELKAALREVRECKRYASGAFGEAPTGEYASDDGEFMYADDILAIVGKALEVSDD